MPGVMLTGGIAPKFVPDHTLAGCFGLRSGMYPGARDDGQAPVTGALHAQEVAASHVACMFERPSRINCMPPFQSRPLLADVESLAVALRVS